jgi:hypothetical protein
VNESSLRVFRNVNFIKRDYECTNVVACQAEVRPGPEWVEADPAILAKLTQLWILGDVRYFGYL